MFDKYASSSSYHSETAVIKNEITDGKTLELYHQLQQEAKDAVKNYYLSLSEDNLFNVTISEVQHNFSCLENDIVLQFTINGREFYLREKLPRNEDFKNFDYLPKVIECVSYYISAEIMKKIRSKEKENARK